MQFRLQSFEDLEQLMTNFYFVTTFTPEISQFRMHCNETCVPESFASLQCHWCFRARPICISWTWQGKLYYINCRVMLHLFSFKGNEYYLEHKFRDLFTVSDTILLGGRHSKHYNKCMRKIGNLMSNNSEVFVN